MAFAIMETNERRGTPHGRGWRKGRRSRDTTVSLAASRRREEVGCFASRVRTVSTELSMHAAVSAVPHTELHLHPPPAARKDRGKNGRDGTDGTEPPAGEVHRS